MIKNEFYKKNNNLIKVKNQIIKLSKRGLSKEDLAIVILGYFHLHISPFKPKGSEISVNAISKAFDLKISEETTIAINKTLFISTILGFDVYYVMINDRFSEILINEIKNEN